MGLVEQVNDDHWVDGQRRHGGADFDESFVFGGQEVGGR